MKYILAILTLAIGLNSMAQEISVKAPRLLTVSSYTERYIGFWNGYNSNSVYLVLKIKNKRFGHIQCTGGNNPIGILYLSSGKNYLFDDFSKCVAAVAAIKNTVDRGNLIKIILRNDVFDYKGRMAFNSDGTKYDGRELSPDPSVYLVHFLKDGHLQAEETLGLFDGKVLRIDEKL